MNTQQQIDELRARIEQAVENHNRLLSALTSSNKPIIVTSAEGTLVKNWRDKSGLINNHAIIPKGESIMNHSEKPNSCEIEYTHLLPEGYDFCTEEDAEKWVKVQLNLDVPESEQALVGYVWNSPIKTFSKNYRPIRKTQYHIAVHEAVTDEPIQEVAEYYQPLFNLLHQEHNVIATQTELDEIIRTARGLGKPLHECKYCGVMTSQPDEQCYKNPYAVDWANAPEKADSHCFDENGKGWFYGTNINDNYWYAENFGISGFTLPTGLDWKLSKTRRPKLK
jgi:hypothetical protein